MDSTNSKHEVIISKRATEMLIKHVRFLAEVNPQIADELRKKIIESSKSLQHLPKRQYLLIYQVKEETVFIEYILDSRQDYSWLF